MTLRSHWEVHQTSLFGSELLRACQGLQLGSWLNMYKIPKIFDLLTVNLDILSSTDWTHSSWLCSKWWMGNFSVLWRSRARYLFYTLLFITITPSSHWHLFLCINYIHRLTHWTIYLLTIFPSCGSCSLVCEDIYFKAWCLHWASFLPPTS